MSNAVIFRDLPATFPEKDQYQKPSIVSSVVFHVLLVVVLILVPLMFPRNVLEQWQLMTYLVAPPPPPPAAAPPPVEVVASAAKPAAAKVVKAPEVNPGALIVPLSIPKDIARIVDEPVDATAGVVGGVVGGIPGGVAGGVLSGILAANVREEVILPPPPPPPPAPAAAAQTFRAPIRVGGMVSEPKITKLVPPVYPALAAKARVTGTVVLEATLTVDGRVDGIKVLSGHPLLVNAAIDCVKQWEYEPTYLNGSPIAVILTAIVKFNPRSTL